jgi:hypothetical protein
MARRARITVTLVEHNDDITLHFEDAAFPPLWFTKRDRPLAHAKLKGVLDQLEIVEEVPVIGPPEFHGQAWSGWEARSA